MTPPRPAQGDDASAPAGRIAAVALSALVLGALFAGASTLFVRLSDLGPIASAFHRAFLAVPALFVLAYVPATSRREVRPSRRRSWLLVLLAGVFFAGDLFFWHLAIVHTTVANATLLATMSPIFVTVLMLVLFGERPTPVFLVGMALAIAGAATIIGDSLAFSPERIEGDLYGICTAVFLAGYLMALGRLRAGGGRLSAMAVMLWSSIVTAAVLLPLALLIDGDVIAASWQGWAVLVALALVSHVGGQGLIAYAMAHLPTSFTSVALVLEVVAAATLGWLFLSEALGPWQWLGAAIVIAGVVVARRGSRRPPEAVPGAVGP